MRNGGVVVVFCENRTPRILINKLYGFEESKKKDLPIVVKNTGIGGVCLPIVGYAKYKTWVVIRI